MEYKFNKEYFLSNDDDYHQHGLHNIQVNFDSNLTSKVLSILHSAGKPYVTLEGDDAEAVKEVVKKVKSKSKKKAKIDEPKESVPTIKDTESNEEES